MPAEPLITSVRPEPTVVVPVPDIVPPVQVNTPPAPSWTAPVPVSVPEEIVMFAGVTVAPVLKVAVEPATVSCDTFGNVAPTLKFCVPLSSSRIPPEPPVKLPVSPQVPPLKLRVVPVNVKAPL